jgi:hydroxymethylglutaryl-CoA synthase
MSESAIGISGLAAYLPRYRVRLEDWCNWYGDSWEKVSAVVGASFRMRGRDENVYTMAATAVVRLIAAYEIDPQRVGMLALGTESSTDNSAGAIIVKGMVNDWLVARGLPRLSRRCEVPEFKHACLGGVYAMKAAARYLAADGRDRQAIVICSDSAEYERGTSGEPTQGAGAVAVLMERDPLCLELDLNRSGSSSDYRGPDFRKPFSRLIRRGLKPHGQPRDFPVFNGKYSTTCYVDEVLLAADDLFTKLDCSPTAFIERQQAVFLHRPYHRMAETGLVMMQLLALARGDAQARRELDGYARDAGIDPQAFVEEITSAPDVFELVRDGNLSTELRPLSAEMARVFRRSAAYQSVADKLRLGAEQMRHVGNLYTASLHAWLAAGLEAALATHCDMAGAEMLAVGYGSGDAAEALSMRVAPRWREAAQRIGFHAALDDAIDLDQAGYQCLHDEGGSQSREPAHRGRGAFVIDRIGNGTGGFDDLDIEYYRFAEG